MSRRAALVLRVVVAWTVWVWAVLISNMIFDTKDGWSFRLLHIGIAIVSLAFAVVTWQITTKSRAFTRDIERQRQGRGNPDSLQRTPAPEPDYRAGRDPLETSHEPERERRTIADPVRIAGEPERERRSIPDLLKAAREPASGRRAIPDPLKTAHALGAATAVFARHWRSSGTSPQSAAPDTSATAPEAAPPPGASHQA